ncbi:MAG: hypothetical protein MUF18_16620 [Fimbriiglobus sp.]|jgi:hypothetical protein|nr:hypothetical protein [Fimbriiglobus sp.]
MREPSDEDFDQMTTAEKAEHARRRAGAKYHHPHLDREGDNGDRRTLFQGLAVAGAVLAVIAVGWALNQQATSEAEREVDRYQRD